MRKLTDAALAGQSRDFEILLANLEPFFNRISSVKSSLLVLIIRPGGHGSLRGRHLPPHHPVLSAGSPMSTTEVALCGPRLPAE